MDDINPTVGSEESVDSCAPCNTPAAEPVFAIGTIALRFPSPAVQREYEFERSSLPTGATEHANLIAVLERRPDLARFMCWVFSTGGIERFYLRPRTDRELQTLIEALKPDEKGNLLNIHVVIGWLAGRQNCGGVELPTVLLEISYHFELGNYLEAMFEAIETGAKAKPAFLAKAKETFEALRNVSGNDGLGRFRALNWVAVRFAPLYDLIHRASERDEILQSIEARAGSAAKDERKVVDVILSFEPRKLGPASRHRLAIDISDLFPYPLGQSFSQVYDF